MMLTLPPLLFAVVSPNYIPLRMRTQPADIPHPSSTLDAGGVPVEIASGTAGLAYSYFIGKRRGYGTERILYKPHNVG